MLFEVMKLPPKLRELHPHERHIFVNYTFVSSKICRNVTRSFPHFSFFSFFLTQKCHVIEESANGGRKRRPQPVLQSF